MRGRTTPQDRSASPIRDRCRSRPRRCSPRSSPEWSARSTMLVGSSSCLRSGPCRPDHRTRIEQARSQEEEATPFAWSPRRATCVPVTEPGKSRTNIDARATPACASRCHPGTAEAPSTQHHVSGAPVRRPSVLRRLLSHATLHAKVPRTPVTAAAVASSKAENFYHEATKQRRERDFPAFARCSLVDAPGSLREPLAEFEHDGCARGGR
jgi:hypothetical protein